MVKAVSLFCASSNKVGQVYYRDAEHLATLLANNGISVMYGGGAVGLMGRVADTILKEKGSITGVIPEFMITMKWFHPDISDLKVVKDMHERKRLLFENTDAIIALPGGCGTLDELIEAITLKQLGQFSKPIIILNTNHFYDGLIDILERMIHEDFMRKEHSEIWQVVNHPEEVIPAILNAPPWDNTFINLAQI